MLALARHNSRVDVYDEGQNLKDNPPGWITRPELANLNESQGVSEGIEERRNEAIKAAHLKRKPQRNAAAAVEAVFTASPDGIQNTADWKEFFKDCRAFVDKKFGKENVLQWNEHWDEKTPHLHVLLVPIVRDQKLGNKYSSSEFLGGREALRETQTELAAQVGKKYGLSRGVEGSKARHTNQVGWAAQLTKKEEELDKREAAAILMEAKAAEFRERAMEALKKTPEQIQILLQNPKALRAYADEREQKILENKNRIQQKRSSGRKI
jgi:hypothetical protein